MRNEQSLTYEKVGEDSIFPLMAGKDMYDYLNSKYPQINEAICYAYTILMFGILNRLRGKFSNYNQNYFKRFANSNRKAFLITAYNSNASAFIRGKALSAYLGYVPFLVVHKAADVRKKFIRRKESFIH